jgi:hypothetical protein
MGTNGPFSPFCHKFATRQNPQKPAIVRAGIFELVARLWQELLENDWTGNRYCPA